MQLDEEAVEAVYGSRLLLVSVVYGIIFVLVAAVLARLRIRVSPLRAEVIVGRDGVGRPIASLPMVRTIQDATVEGQREAFVAASPLDGKARYALRGVLAIRCCRMAGRTAASVAA